jgi:hypothetical protein
VPAGTPTGDAPFCCKSLKLFKKRKVEHESAFSSLLAHRGHHPRLVFEVKTFVDKGPLLNTKYFQLEKGHIKEVSVRFIARSTASKITNGRPLP